MTINNQVTRNSRYNNSTGKVNNNATGFGTEGNLNQYGSLLECFPFSKPFKLWQTMKKIP